MSPGVTPEPPGAASKGTPLVVLAALALLPAAESLVAVWLEILPCLVFPLAKAAMIAAPLFPRGDQVHHIVESWRSIV